MCGIYGQFNYGDPRPVDEREIRQATTTIAHRGPDDEGFYIAGPVGLGFRRLSIIDLAAGHQPMADRERSVWLVFNGEIYNFRELRAQLESRGHVFQTNSDTEAIIHAYKEWGEDAFEHLNGMFGLAIWDVRQRKLILARDAMGIKPLYYRLESNTLFFGSEIRPLLVAAGADLDPVALNLFLRYRYTPSPRTLFEGIRKLAPGTMLVAERARVRVKRWYQFTPTPFTPRKSFREAKEELASHYKAALDRHLISDVPVGLLLSGGIDSSLLLALMSRVGTSWPTYTVGYGSVFGDDELSDADRTARHFSSRHVSLELTTERFEQVLPKVVASLEEPVATSSIVPMYLICERARRDVKVALVGQGPDELFGGYTRHLGVHYGGMWRDSPTALRRLAAGVLSLWPRQEMLRRGLYSLDVPDRLKRYQSVFSILPESTVDGLFQDGLIPASAGDTILDCWAEVGAAAGEMDELGGFQFLEIRSSLPDELLIYSDKLSMAHGLEVRVPYLDREIVEYAQRLDASFKVRRGSRKVLHRAVCADFLPREVIRRKKRGFASNVVDDWFRRSIGRRMDAMLVDRESLMFRFLRPSAVRDLLQSHKSGAVDNHKILFSLVVFEMWLRSLGASVEREPVYH
ncbi:MAG: asparagine synthase (glutamine-hydrolyzing) [Acidobacteria bacterium]|nr:MAG: asparagine synthase (glutamine-hydrolyzing) [Acidobacteriota bacterium]PYR52401.1 MAG: asparagine synthase (glutamine-hydrolyzing) [Acidobacteriota bacterium]